ncbi:MAG TPA: histidine--tRNA ligase [Candidatus Bathyarchaeia archaeon]|nr:histidine--tRNA ligase [Candidatus Bathyarchaeia archaeon]
MPETFSLPRGMKDTEPEEMTRRIWLYDKIREVVLRYGFRLVEPSTVEHLTTLEAKSGPSIRNEIYWFKDKSGRSLGLRFDLTVGLARMIASRSDLPEPIKYATIGGNWRYDEPQFGRYRYFTQWDVEIFGSANPLADAEAICVGADILENVGLKDFKIRISNRKLTEAYLKELGLRTGEKLDQTLRIIDKFRKVTRQELEKEFRAAEINPEAVDKILDFISISGTPRDVLERLTKLNLQEEHAKSAISELQILSDCLEAFGRIDNCIYDLSIVRGISYYDGIVFEAYDSNEAVGAIFGGGRYDGLCKVYGKRDLPATGVAGGIERLMISLEQANLFPQMKSAAKIFIATVQNEVIPGAIKIAKLLREKQIATEMDLKGRSLSKQLEYVDSSKIPYLIVVGRRELESQIVKIKNTATRTEIEVTLNELVSRIQSLD